MASSIINSDDGVISGTSGLKSTGGDDGVLVFQSKGTETAQINTDSQIVAAAGTASLPVLTTTGDLNTGIYFPAADNIGFATGGTIRGRWTTDGLCFGSDTAAANALDDYEEGTFTPTVTGGSTAGTGTYEVQVGRYTKIGNRVTVQAAVYLTAHTGTGAIQLTNLPFTSVNVSNTYSAVSLFLQITTLTAGNYAQAAVFPNTTRIDLYQYPTGGGNTSTVSIDQDSQVIYTATYEVN